MFGDFYGNFVWGLLMLLHMILPVLLIILAVTLGAGLWDRVWKKRDHYNGMQASILKERYSRGEITQEEFFRMKEDLTRV